MTEKVHIIFIRSQSLQTLHHYCIPSLGTSSRCGHPPRPRQQGPGPDPGRKVAPSRSAQTVAHWAAAASSALSSAFWGLSGRSRRGDLCLNLTVGHGVPFGSSLVSVFYSTFWELSARFLKAFLYSSVEDRCLNPFWTLSDVLNSTFCELSMRFLGGCYCWMRNTGEESPC